MKRIQRFVIFRLLKLLLFYKGVRC